MRPRPYLTVGVPNKPVRRPTNGRLPLSPAPPGRPPSNIGSYLIRPTPEDLSGFEMLNDTPRVLKDVNDRYLKSFQLPPALQPKYLRKPEVMEHGVGGRATKISQGWRKPRSRAG